MRADGLGLLLQVAQWPQVSIAGQHYIQTRQFFRGHLATAEGQGQAIVALVAQAFDAGALQQTVQ